MGKSQPNRNIARLVAMYGSAAEIGRIAGVHRTAVARWIENGWAISPAIQVKLLREGAKRGFPLGEVASCLGVDRCDCCEAVIHREIRALLGPAGQPRGGCVPSVGSGPSVGCEPMADAGRASA
jgi:hypothetical protein